MSDRRAPSHLHVEISPESRAGWQRFATDNGLTMAAMAEAVGLVLAAGLPARVHDELVTIARAVTAERRSRRPR